MTEEQKNHLKEKILKDIEHLIKEIEDLKEKNKPIPPENSIGRLTRLDAMGEKSINDAMLEKCEQRLKKLLYVNDRTEENSFGCCNICDEDINYERLKILPESTICIECANEME